MAEMILIGDPTMRRLDPKLLPKEEKQEAHAKGHKYRCTCRRDTELIYKFDSRLALQPEIRGGETAGNHAIDCDMNARYAKSAARRNPIYIESVTGTMTVRVFENITRRADRNQREREYEPFKKIWSKGSSIPSTSHVINAIKEANLDVSYRQANPYRRSGIKDIYRYSQEVYQLLKTVNVAKGSIPDGLHVNENDDGDKGFRVSNGFNDYRSRQISTGSYYGFFYDVLSDLEYLTYDTGRTKNISLKDCAYDLNEFTKYPNKLYGPVLTTEYMGSAGELKNKYLRLTEDGLKMAVYHYMKDYGTTHLDAAKGRFIATGFLYEIPLGRAKGSVWQIDRLYIFRVNDYGIYCESSYEAQAYDVIMHEAERDPRLHFYKPGRFSPNVYGGEMREDGVITIDGCYKKGIVEVFGRVNDEAYAIRQAIKEKYLERSRDRYVFIPWNRAAGESIDDFRETLAWGIEEIRKGGGF